MTGVIGRESSLRPSRIATIDWLRGVVMLLMVLDHTRDFVHTAENPTRLATTTVVLFLTRFVTHFCAPTFILLAGMGARLQGERGKTTSELSRFLATRGLWLICLELTVVRFGITFSLDYHQTAGILQVIWVIGASMLVLAGLVYLPLWAIATFAAIVMAGSNVLDHVPFFVSVGQTPKQIAFMLLHASGPIRPFGDLTFILGYPLLPWVGVMAGGYVLGGLYMKQTTSLHRQRTLYTIGGMMLVIFLMLRGWNLYGDPSPWFVQIRGPVYTMLSFINVTKYPVSLLYLLLTLGPVFILLGFIEGVTNSVSSKQELLGSQIDRWLITFGRVPLFFYLLQWFVAHGLCAILRGAFNHPDGFGLPMTYAVWIVCIIILYWPCRWFAHLKATQRSWWLSYL